MGVINHDIFTTRHGIELTDSYLAIGNESISVTKTVTDPNPKPASLSYVSTMVTPSPAPQMVTIYRVTAMCRVYASLDARKNNKDFVDMIPLTIESSSPTISANLYEFVYAKLKEKYTNTEDVIEA